jgi:hypothetical protein
MSLWAPVGNPPWEGSAAPPGQRERGRSLGGDDRVTTATPLFANNRVDATIIEQITELADASPRTFLRHFTSEKDVPFELANQIVTPPASSNDWQRLVHAGNGANGANGA